MKFAKRRQILQQVQSPPSRGAWIEICHICIGHHLTGSPPSRGAWIEIASCAAGPIPAPVAPLAGGVD